MSIKTKTFMAIFAFFYCEFYMNGEKIKGIFALYAKTPVGHRKTKQTPQAGPDFPIKNYQPSLFSFEPKLTKIQLRNFVKAFLKKT